MTDPEKCGALMTVCPHCRHAVELPDVHFRLCKLADERDRLAEALLLIKKGSDEPDSNDESKWMQYIASMALAGLEKP